MDRNARKTALLFALTCLGGPAWGQVPMVPDAEDSVVLALCGGMPVLQDEARDQTTISAQQDRGPGMGRGMRPGAARGTGPMGGRMNRPGFQEFDLNGDGAVHREEFQQVRIARQQERAELGYSMRGAAHAPAFEEFDSNGDGRVTREEFSAYQLKRYQGPRRTPGE